MRVLVIDVVGSRVKMRVNEGSTVRRFPSEQDLKLGCLVKRASGYARDRRLDVVSPGCPAVVRLREECVEPHDDWRRGARRVIR